MRCVCASVHVHMCQLTNDVYESDSREAYESSRADCSLCTTIHRMRRGVHSRIDQPSRDRLESDASCLCRSLERTDTRTVRVRVAASLRLVLNHSPLLAAEAPTRFEESSPLQQLPPMICLLSGRGSGERVEEGVAVTRTLRATPAPPE